MPSKAKNTNVRVSGEAADPMFFGWTGKVRDGVSENTGANPDVSVIYSAKTISVDSKYYLGFDASNVAIDGDVYLDYSALMQNALEQIAQEMGVRSNLSKDSLLSLAGMVVSLLNAPSGNREAFLGAVPAVMAAIEGGIDIQSALLVPVRDGGTAQFAPRQAPEKYADRSNKSEAVMVFLRRVYGGLIRPKTPQEIASLARAFGPIKFALDEPEDCILHRSNLRRMDSGADAAIEQWIACKKAWPDDIYLPSKASVKDAIIRFAPEIAVSSPRLARRSADLTRKHLSLTK